jgi:hypothetical protein
MRLIKFQRNAADVLHDQKVQMRLLAGWIRQVSEHLVPGHVLQLLQHIVQHVPA